MNLEPGKVEIQIQKPVYVSRIMDAEKECKSDLISEYSRDCQCTPFSRERAQPVRTCPQTLEPCMYAHALVAVPTAVRVVVSLYRRGSAIIRWHWRQPYTIKVRGIPFESPPHGHSDTIRTGASVKTGIISGPSPARFVNCRGRYPISARTSSTGN